jgi:hypothetical protein
VHGRLLCGLVLLGMLSVASAAADEAASGRVSIQLVSPDPDARVRLALDGRALPEPARPPAPESPGESWPPPLAIGSFELARDARHSLVAQVDGIALRAELVFAADAPQQWIVVHHHPGGPGGDPPPTLAFSLQTQPYLAK